MELGLVSLSVRARKFESAQVSSDFTARQRRAHSFSLSMAETEDGQARESLLENGETTVTQAVGSVGLERKGNPSGMVPGCPSLCLKVFFGHVQCILTCKGVMLG